MPGDNPKYVLFCLMTGSDRLVIAADKTVSNATVFDLGKNDKTKLKDANDYIIDKLREHVKKYGTIEELMIAGHGSTESMESKDHYNKIDTKQIILGIERLEAELGKKITNRVVFNGCETFSNMTNNQIKFYRDYADKLDIEITGSSSFQMTFFSASTGRYVQFTPKGEVIRDKLDTRYNPFAMMHDDRTWVDYHLNHTQGEAEKAIRSDIINAVSSLINMGNIPLSHDEEFNNDKGAIEKDLVDKLFLKDAQTDRTDVLLSKDEKSAVIIGSDGMVHTRGNIRPHKLVDSEKSGEIKELEGFIAGLKGVISDDDRKRIEDAEDGLNYNISSQNPNGKHFSVVVLDNNKRVLLATEDGGFEVINTAVPAASNSSTPNKSTNGKSR